MSTPLEARSQKGYPWSTELWEQSQKIKLTLQIKWWYADPLINTKMHDLLNEFSQMKSQWGWLLRGGFYRNISVVCSNKILSGTLMNVSSWDCIIFFLKKFITCEYLGSLINIFFCSLSYKISPNIAGCNGPLGYP